MIGFPCLFALPLALGACDAGLPDPAPDSATQEETAAIEEAAAMLAEQRQPEDAPQTEATNAPSAAGTPPA